MQCERWIFNGQKWVPEKPKTKPRQIHTIKDLDVYYLSYALAMEVFWTSAKYPKDELYKLTDQIRRSSRSVCGTLVEGFAKRRYENVFKSALNDSIGSSDETKLWLNMSLDCGYLLQERHRELYVGYEQVGSMLWRLMNNWRDYS